MRSQRHRGIALIAAIMLIVFASIAVLGIVVFVTQRLNQNVNKELSSKTIYLAQAGLHNALYDFRFHDIAANGYFTLGQTNIDANNFFVLSGTAANLLMVNTVGSVLQSGSRNVAVWPIQNATNSQTITIATMTVSWSGVAANRRLQQIWLGNTPTQVWPTGGGNGSGTSGTIFNITDFTLDTTPTLYTNGFLRFNASMSGATVTVTFTMTDSSSATLTLFPSSNNDNFTVNSKGQTTGSAINRTIQATYNANTGHITTYKEI